ncbi:MAG TPA: hypothetical protein VFU29_19270 [Chitinophagaceae bacterium]|nr:hypothetical protein [Chitinophagaceae bacterium]
MEVHHHSHTPHKKWTHYFWEFLMLFLAVFAGFLAENQREHYIEHQREKQYIRSLVNDVKSDISQLEELDKEWAECFRKADTLLKYLAGKDIYTNSGPALTLVYWATGFTDFVSDDGTIQQLKNSGGLRLLRKSKITDSIMAYQKTVDRLTIKQEGMNDAQQFRNRVTDLFNMIQITAATEEKPIPLLNVDSKAVNSAYSYILEWKGEFAGLRILGNNAKDCGARLLKIIFEQYGIR